MCCPDQSISSHKQPLRSRQIRCIQSMFHSLWMCSKILGATSADCTFGRGSLPPVYLIWQSRLTCTCVWDTGGLLQVKLNCLFCIDLYNNHHKGEKSRLGLKICFAKVAMIWSKDWDKRQWLIACVWTPTLTPGKACPSTSSAAPQTQKGVIVLACVMELVQMVLWC